MENRDFSFFPCLEVKKSALWVDAHPKKNERIRDRIPEVRIFDELDLLRNVKREKTLSSGKEMAGMGKKDFSF